MELQAQKKRFIEIDSLKGFAMFFVILGHAIILFPINLHQNPYCLWLFTFVSSVHVPLFFAVSGFCFSYKGFKNYISKKAKRILLPYFVFSFFVTIQNDKKLYTCTKEILKYRIAGLRMKKV